MNKENRMVSMGHETFMMFQLTIDEPLRIGNPRVFFQFAMIYNDHHQVFHLWTIQLSYAVYSIQSSPADRYTSNYCADYSLLRVSA